MFSDANVGQRITTLRAQRGLSQAQLAELIGIGPTQLHRYEAGRAVPRPTTLAKIAAALGTKAAWLAKGDSSDQGGQPGHDFDELVVRLPAGMRHKLTAMAEAKQQSLNSEVVQRLEWSFKIIGEPKVEPANPTPQPIGGDLTWYITAEIKKLAEAQSAPFDEMLAKIFVAGLHPNAPQVLYAPIFPGATSKDMRAVLEASEAIAKPDATLISEMIQRAPWAPSWLADRLKSQGLDEASTAPDSSLGDVETNAIAVEVKSSAAKPGIKRISRKPRAKGKSG